MYKLCVIALIYINLLIYNININIHIGTQGKLSELYKI